MKNINAIKNSLPSLLFAGFCFISASAIAGDAIYWDIGGGSGSIRYISSTTPKGGSDYKNSTQANQMAMNDAHSRGYKNPNVISDSDLTGYVCVAAGHTSTGQLIPAVRYAKTQAEADKQALNDLSPVQATRNESILYEFFSYGENSVPASPIPQ